MVDAVEDSPLPATSATVATSELVDWSKKATFPVGAGPPLPEVTMADRTREPEGLMVWLAVNVTNTITVAKSPTAIIVTPATLTPTAGGSLLVTAAITATTYGTTLPSGTVTVLLDGVAVGVGTVVTGSPSTATITIPVVSAGSHVVTATYSGDTYYAASTTSTGISLLVAKGATATTVTARCV